MTSAAAARSVTILSTADFDSPVWTNKQHLAVGLAEHLPVQYIESMGLRQPRFNVADLKRIKARLVGTKAQDSIHLTRRSPDRLGIVAPSVIPFHARSSVRAVNRRLIERRLLPRLGGSIDILWTFSPMTYGLEHAARTTVYHSVDLLHEQPGLPAQALLSAERSLVHRADHVIASSSAIAEHLKSLGRPDVILWENVAHVDLFAAASVERQPRAIFAGNLTPAKVDFHLLLQVVEKDVDLALAGPIGIDGTRSAPGLTRLLDHPRTTYLGILSLAELAAECQRSTVGLIPYVLDAHTRGIFPMKTFEYLAAGLPVVSTPLESLLGTSIVGVTLARGGEYADKVEQLVASFDPEAVAGRREAAESNSWTSRISSALELIGSKRG